MKKITLKIDGKEQTFNEGSVVEVERKGNGITNAGYLHARYDASKYYQNGTPAYFIRICLDRYGTIGRAEDIMERDIISIKELK